MKMHSNFRAFEIEVSTEKIWTTLNSVDVQALGFHALRINARTPEVTV